HCVRAVTSARRHGMNAPQKSDARTSNGEAVPPTDVKRPEVRPEVSIWDIREVKESRLAQAIKSFVQACLVPGVITALVVIVGLVCRTEGMDSGHKIAIATIAIQALTILGLAFLLTGAKTHATTAEDNPDQSAHP